MKGTYRLYVRRETNPYDWELVGSCADADEAWAKAKRWEETTSVVAVRVDLCVRHFEREDMVHGHRQDETCGQCLV